MCDTLSLRRKHLSRNADIVRDLKKGGIDFLYIRSKL